MQRGRRQRHRRTSLEFYLVEGSLGEGGDADALPPMIYGPTIVVAILAAYALAMAFRSSHVSVANVFGFAMPQSSRSRGLIFWNLTLMPLPS